VQAAVGAGDGGGQVQHACVLGATIQGDQQGIEHGCLLGRPGMVADVTARTHAVRGSQ
jgi:hypothetical protein